MDGLCAVERDRVRAGLVERVEGRRHSRHCGGGVLGGRLIRGSRTARLSAALPARFWVASGTVLALGVAWLLVWPVRIGPCGIGQDDAVSCSGQQISAVGVALPNLPGGTELAIVILAGILVGGVVVFLRTGTARRR